MHGISHKATEHFLQVLRSHFSSCDSPVVVSSGCAMLAPNAPVEFAITLTGCGDLKPP
jgi:hypothetical protein